MAGTELLTMPSPKKDKPTMGRPRATDPALPIASFKGKAKFKKWFEDFARERRVDNSTLIEHALVAYAKECGHKAPPER